MYKCLRIIITIIKINRYVHMNIIMCYFSGIIMSRGDGMRLKELRKKKHITQLRLAMDLNMNQNTISRYETGEREADYKTLIMFADYFNVSVDYLFERTDDPTFLK